MGTKLAVIAVDLASHQMVNSSALEIAKAKYSFGTGRLAKIIGQLERITKYASTLNGIQRNLVKSLHAVGIVIFVYGIDFPNSYF